MSLDEVRAIYPAITSLTTTDERGAMDAYAGDRTKSDAVVCAGVRAFQAIVVRLSEADLATAARFEMQP